MLLYWSWLAGLGLVTAATAGFRAARVWLRREDKSPDALQTLFLTHEFRYLGAYFLFAFITFWGAGMARDGLTEALNYLPMCLFWLTGWLLFSMVAMAVDSLLIRLVVKNRSMVTAACTVLPPISLVAVFLPMLE